MTTSRNHQGAHGIGQIEEQLRQQAEAAEAIQGLNKVDKEIAKEVYSDPHTSLDDIIIVEE